MNMRATRMASLSQTQRYGIAVVGVVVAAVFRLGLSASLHDLPVLVFLFPIILASWCGGLGPGLLASGLSVVVGEYPFDGSPSQLLMQALTMSCAGAAVSILFDRNRKTINVQQYAQDIIDAMPGGVAIYDCRQKKNVFMNRVIFAALGYPPGPDADEAGYLRSLMHA